MTKTKTSKPCKVVAVLGDVNIDKVLYRVPESDNEAYSNSRYERISHPGGAVLLQEILKSTLGTQENREIKIIGYKDIVKLDMSDWREALTVLELFPRDERGDERVYRIDKTYGWIEPELGTIETQNKLITDLGEKLTEYADCEALVVINDKGLGFSKYKHHKQLLSKFNKPNILISLDNCSERTLDSKLWQTIISNNEFKENTTVIVTASALRTEGISIHVTTSLEQTAEELVDNMEHKVLKQLMQCQHLIIAFSHFHVMHWNKTNPTTAFCYFPPFVDKNITIERLFEQPEQFGKMAGYRTVLLAALAQEMAKSMAKGLDPFISLPIGITNGLRLCKKHLSDGFAKEGFHTENEEYRLNYRSFTELFKSFKHPLDKTRKTKLAKTLLRLDGMTDWSRVSNIHDECGDEESFNQLLVNIVTKGLPKVATEPLRPLTNIDNYSDQPHLENMVSIPYAEFGKLLTTNRQEIERFTDMYLLMQKYIEDKRWKTPLCLAVFGPPGSGKSFTIKQIMKSVQKSETKPLVYNLSQFIGIDDLTTAFHQTQDRALAEEVPLIIFDEFDSKFDRDKLGWLKYFLEPMQDGTFRARGNTYRVGRAIFIFAGGVNESFTELNSKKNIQKYKDAKLPDFISRLKGHLDILGIDSTTPEVGIELMFRRAVILSSILKNCAASILHKDKNTAGIDKDVVIAFLKIPLYKHGTRSMEAIIQMSLLEKGKKIMASSLPARAQLNMHVNADEFLNLMRGASNNSH